MGSEEGEEVALGSPNDWKEMKREDGRYQTNGGWKKDFSNGQVVVDAIASYARKGGRSSATGLLQEDGRCLEASNASLLRRKPFSDECPCK